MSRSPVSLVVLGSINMDLVMRVPALPRPGTTTLGGSFATFPGGKGANQAVAAARLGAATALVGCVGDDGYGAALRAAIREGGVDDAHVRCVAGTPSGIGLILIDERTGENMISVASGANGVVTFDQVEEAAPCIRRASLLVLQSEVPVEANIWAASIARRGAGAARSGGPRVLLNAAPASRLPAELLALVDVLVVNEHEACELTGLALPRAPESLLDALAALGPRIVVITLGAQGCLVRDAARARAIEPFAVTAIDTVGAGDAFVGALAVGLVRGETLDHAARSANAAGALSVTKHGAIASLPTTREVEELLERRCHSQPR